jgi:membrane-associated phospholipid phosphatase
MSTAAAAAPRGLDPRVRASLAAFLLLALFLPLDAGIGSAFRGLDLPSDIEGELEFLQQYGQFSSAVLGTLAILLLQPAARGRLLDWWAALGLTVPICHGIKMLLGRPRPKLADPYQLTLPWESYLRERPGGPDEWIRAIDFEGADLWSMPSSHTAAAVVMSLFLARLFPPLRPLALGMAIVVGACRVVLGKHWPSDVVVGALIGFLVADAAWRGAWGQRLLRALRGARRRA